mgnify:FL=1
MPHSKKNYQFLSMSDINTNEEEGKKNLNFIEAAVEKDLAEGKNGGRVQTRFPPEPNGYLHIGHAKAICLDFGIAERHGGICNLRFDDTNPTKEDEEYVEAIKEDIQWLGYQWGNIYYASDYFQQLWDFAIRLIEEGKAYIDEQTSEQIAQQKGTPTQPGIESPYRDRPIEESLALFKKMNTGEIAEGAMVLRAKIDMANPNMHFRDPIIYRVVNHPHHRTGTTWKAYPMYDFAHGQSDFFEGVTHSLCTLEFVVHRPLYDLFIDWLKEGEDLNDNRPRQTEFNKLNLSYTLMSKRNLLTLVKENLVNGWDDPRMPTICGLRRRGYTPASIRDFCERIGVSKANSVVDSGLLDYCIRDDLKAKAKVVMAVLDPLKLVITNYPEDQVEMMELENNPETPELGKRLAPFTRELYIEREDFMEEPVKKFFRLAPGKEVRLKGAYFVTCTDFVKDENGIVTEVHCTYDPETRSGSGFEGRKVKGTLHWVSAKDNVQATARLYDYMMLDNPEDPNGEMIMNPNSLEVKECFIEPSVKDAKKGDRFQFMRNGYYIVDTKDTTEEHLVFNRIVPLKSSFKLK